MWAIPGRMIALVFVIALLFLPLITTSPYIVRLATLTAIWAIFAASWDVLAGFTGQLNLGQALFFGVAAYIAAFLNLHLSLAPWATIPIGALAAVTVGLIVAIPAMRVRGFYLALVTLAFPIILLGIIDAFPDITGGEFGLAGISRLSESKILDYYIIVLVMAVCVFLMWKLTDTGSKSVRLGVILRAINEDEIAARAAGINTVRYKLLAFSISGFFAGIAGGLYAHVFRIVGPSTLLIWTSFYPIMWTIFGGIGTIYGPVTGAFILYPLVDALGIVAESYRMLIFAILVIVILLVMPEGLTVWFRDKIERVCPRCGLINITTRRTCRACGAMLHLERE